MMGSRSVVLENRLLNGIVNKSNDQRYDYVNGTESHTVGLLRTVFGVVVQYGGEH